jgi:hypothetical protein
MRLLLYWESKERSKGYADDRTSIINNRTTGTTVGRRFRGLKGRK